MTPDMINGGMQMIGALLLANNCRLTIKHRAAKGVSMISTCLFSVWGAWSIYYYASLSQWYSVTGGAMMVAMDVVWIGLMMYFRDDE